jgi:anaerobic selenocysteine-containing dehydrogenase
MADEISNIDRRSFLKNAGVIIGGGAIGAAGIALRPEMALAADAVKSVPRTVTQFRCPMCNKDFASFAELKQHFKPNTLSM